MAIVNRQPVDPSSPPPHGRSSDAALDRDANLPPPWNIAANAERARVGHAS